VPRQNDPVQPSTASSIFGVPWKHITRQVSGSRGSWKRLNGKTRMASRLNDEIHSPGQ